VKLHELGPAKGSRTRRERIGRGLGAGRGKTSGRGQKGQGARSSVGLPVGFEGGQMPLTQRLPKLRGFHNKWRKEFAIVNVGKLERFNRDSVVDPAALAEAGLIARPTSQVKILAAGQLRTPLTLRVHRISAAARTSVEAAGGSVELIAGTKPAPAEGPSSDGDQAQP